MTKDEAAYYINSVRTVADDTSLDNHQLRVIQLLRLFCTHPFVYDKHLHGDPILYSNKYSRLCELLSEIFSSNEKVIVFTSFSEMIQILVKDIRQRFGIYTDFIDGSVPESDRQTVIDNFSSHEGSALLALNPIAAGSGLNITAANHVIHYNLEWNPAKEDQASARAYRNGQEKTVFVHRLYYEGTIEEFIDEKICNKRTISSTAVIGTLGQNTREDLRKVLSMSPITTDNYDNN
jgi:SNF2 family DNA or RNA helicase